MYNVYMTRNKKNIVIIGAGFGGITVVLKLSPKIANLSQEYEIILIDRHHHQLYTPALYEIAAIPRDYVPDEPLKSSVLIPVTDIIKNRPVTFVCDELVGLEMNEKKVILQKRGEIPYEFLVLALGSETNYFDIPGLKEHSFPLKTFDDANRLRKAVEDNFLQKESLQIVVGGAGASGVELVAEFVNFLCSLKAESSRVSGLCDVQFSLVDASPEILQGFESYVVEKTKKRLAKLGIKIKTNAVIASIPNESEIVFKNGSREPYDLLIWTGGVKGPGIYKQFKIPLSNKGAIVVDEFLGVQGQKKHVFAIGDNSTLINPLTQKPLVWNVPVAEAEGRLVAKNIINLIKNKPLRKFIPLKKYPFVLAVGRKYAIADLIYLRFSGTVGWCLKQLVELRYFLFVLPFGQALRMWWKSVKYFTTND